MDAVQSHSESPEAKLSQIFGFLKEFASLQNPVIRQVRDYPFFVRLAEIPSHPCISIPIRQGTTEEDEFVLRIRRPVITSPRRIDDILQDWVATSQNPEKRPTRLDSVNVRTDQGTSTVSFEDSIDRVNAWEKWVAAWDRWAEAERPNRVADTFFQRIYALRAILNSEAESFELLLGDGNLICPEVQIDHPIVSQRLDIEFNPKVPEFTLRVSNAEAELNTPLLWDLPDKNGEEIGNCKRALADEGLSPSDPLALQPFLSRTKMVVPYGEFFDEPPASPRRCYIYPSTVLYLRRRSGGFSDAIQGILDAIPTLDELPPALLQICGIGNPLLENEEDRSGENDNHYGNEQEDILFTKPANREQVEIVDRLKRHGTVIVQGPPGTGKSYTIGNIIGHLLAQGKRILVTAQTTKALQVVRDQVVEELRSLCVAVLGDDVAAQSELEKAVASILEHLDKDPKQLRREAAPLIEKRRVVLKELKEARAKSVMVRSNEYREITLAGKTFSPSEAARLVKDGFGKHSWIPTPVDRCECLPIDTSAVVRLYATNQQITADEESELLTKNPATVDLPIPARFAELMDILDRAEKRDTTTGANFWIREPRDTDAEHIRELTVLCNRINHLLNSEKWRFTVVAESMASPDLKAKWGDTAKAIRDVESEANEFSRIAAEHGPEFTGIDDGPLDKCLQHLSDIEAHIRNNGGLGSLSLLFKPKWKAILASCTVNGRKPARAEEIGALCSLLKIQESRRLLVLRWNRTLAPAGANSTESLGNSPERILIHYAVEIEALIDWKTQFFDPLLAHLASSGFDWDAAFASIPSQYSEHGHLLRLNQAICQLLPSILDARMNLLDMQIASREIDRATSTLRRVAEKGGASRVSHVLTNAVTARDIQSYSDGFNTLAELEKKREVLDVRESLLSRLQSFAPSWATAIRLRNSLHQMAEPPGDARSAWEWRQLADELERRDAETPEGIDRKIEELSRRLFELTANIASKLAWAHQLESLEGNQRARMALIGWQQTIQRLGRGTGKTVAARRRQARDEMRKAKEAVPVWVMPLKKVLENFDPVETRFDAIIIDEASQCDVLGLVPLFMARTIIVVGDHEQVSPDAVGMKQDDIDRIVQTHLQGIPQSHLYDGKASIYQFAQRAFSGTIMLREHFRCDSRIISFSNRLCYGGKIVPLRDTSRVQTRPALVPYKVEGVNISKANEAEAFAVASLVAACLERPEYQYHSNGEPVTYGVISLVGTEQAEKIRTILSQKLDLALIEKHRILCGNPPQFQGDERDIVFLSMVDSPEGGGPLRMRQEDRYKKRFNVAASRARNQSWLIYSLDPNVDLQKGDLRRRIIEHFLNPDALEEKILDAEGKAESEFERRVIRRLVGEGYVIHPQWKVGKYRIDLVIEGERNRLAVELDGDKYHPPEKLAEDMERQAMLERAGWRFVRIRGSRFFRSEDEALSPLYHKLEELDIRPLASASPSAQTVNESIEEIRARASHILNEWQIPSPKVPVQTQVPAPTQTEVTVPVLKTNNAPESDLFQQISPVPIEIPATVSSAKPSLGKPFNIERFALYVGLPLKDIQDLVWHEAFWAGSDKESMPTKIAQALARKLSISLNEF